MFSELSEVQFVSDISLRKFSVIIFSNIFSLLVTLLSSSVTPDIQLLIYLLSFIFSISLIS